MPRVLPDANDVIVWRMNEGALPFVNSSTSPSSYGANANLVSMTGTVVLDALSVFGEKCPYFPAQGTYPAGASSTRNRLLTAGGLSALAISSPISVSGWVKLRNYLTGGGDNFGLFLHKRYRNDTSWSEPYVVVNVSHLSSGDGQWKTDVTVGGTRTQVTVAANPSPLPSGVWFHVGMTYDGTTQRAYLNGMLAGSTAQTGAIDNGTHGPWCFGAAADAAGLKQEPAAMMCDWRVANVARSAAYFENIYRRGVLSW
jgi:hypothetical protein